MFPYSASMACDTVEVVRRPRPADAVGAALRSVYGGVALPEDMSQLLRRLEKAH